MNTLKSIFVVALHTHAVLLSAEEVSCTANSNATFMLENKCSGDK